MWRTILDEVDGDVSLEVTATEPDGMTAQGRDLAKLGDNAVVKLPMTPDGLAAATTLGAEGSGSTSPSSSLRPRRSWPPRPAPTACRRSWARIDDAGADGMGVLRTICDLYAVQGYQTNVLAASLRHPMHVVDAALAGADIATMPFDVFTKLVEHPLTDIGLAKFQADWNQLQRELGGEATS